MRRLYLEFDIQLQLVFTPVSGFSPHTLSLLPFAMSLKLHELTNDEDFKAINATEHEAYSNPFNGVFELTKGTSPEEACARQLVWHKIQPGSHWVYVTDESTGEVIGGTRYIIYETNPYAVEQPVRKASWLPEGA